MARPTWKCTTSCNLQMEAKTLLETPLLYAQIATEKPTLARKMNGKKWKATVLFAQKRGELLDGEATGTDQAAQSAFGNLPMVRDR